MRYDLASSSWRTCAATSLWDLEMSSPTFPEWGMTLGGELYELPTPERPTPAPASSSLPTPTARDYEDTTISAARHRPDDDDTLSRALAHLLPTPTVMDMGSNYTPEQWEAWKAAKKAQHNNGNGHGASLTQEAISLLPTPTAQQGRNATSGRKPDAIFNSGTTLQDVIYAGEIGSTGASTPPPSPDGSTFSGDDHPLLPFPASTADRASRPDSWNG